jgi:hypothetical protein
MTELTAFMEAVMQEAEEFYSDVTEIAEKNQGHADFKEYSRKSTADYVGDLARAEKLYEKYCDAYEAVTEQGPTPARVKTLEKAYAAFSLSVSAVDAGNAMFTAFLDEGVAGKAAGLFTLLGGIISGQQKMAGELLDDIEDIEKLLKKAKKDVTGARAQMGLNLAVTAVTLCFPPLRGAKAVFVALSVSGGKLVADEFLGPSGPSNASAVKTAVTDYGGLADEIGKVGNTLTTIYSTVDTYASDDAELGKAKKTVASVRKKLEAAQKAHAALVRRMADSDRDLLAMAVALEKSVKAAAAARDRYARRELQRMELIDMIED